MLNVPTHDVFGTLQRAHGYGPPQNDRVWFEAVGDYPTVGCGTFPTVGLIEAVSDPDSPFPGWDFYGWRMLGDGTVDVRFYTSTIGITPTSVTFDIMLNGIVVESVFQLNFGNGNDATVTATALPVSSGDVITCQVTSDPGGVPFFRTPRGVGDCAEALTITGGFLV